MHALSNWGTIGAAINANDIDIARMDSHSDPTQQSRYLGRRDHLYVYLKIVDRDLIRKRRLSTERAHALRTLLVRAQSALIQCKVIDVIELNAERKAEKSFLRECEEVIRRLWGDEEISKSYETAGLSLS